MARTQLGIGFIHPQFSKDVLWDDTRFVVANPKKIYIYKSDTVPRSNYTVALKSSAVPNLSGRCNP